MDAKGIWNTAITRTNYSSTYKVMKRPLRKDYPTHAAWVAAVDKFNAAKPKQKDYESYQAWVAAVQEFNKASKPDKKTKLKIVKPIVKSVGKTDFNVATETGKKAYEKALAISKKEKNVAKENNVKKNNENNEKKVENKDKLKIKSTTVGGPVEDGVEYARSKGDDLAGYRRQKDTRITKKLKKAGFTEDRLARLRKKNAEFQAAKKDKKKMKAYRAKYG